MWRIIGMDYTELGRLESDWDLPQRYCGNLVRKNGLVRLIALRLHGELNLRQCRKRWQIGRKGLNYVAAGWIHNSGTIPAEFCTVNLFFYVHGTSPAVLVVLHKIWVILVLLCGSRVNQMSKYSLRERARIERSISLLLKCSQIQKNGLAESGFTKSVGSVAQILKWIQNQMDGSWDFEIRVCKLR